MERPETNLRTIPCKDQRHELLLTEEQLAARWQISTDKLRMDRWRKVGCPYLKLGRLVRYSITDVLAFEVSITVNPKG